MPQHTSSEVKVGYALFCHVCNRSLYVIFVYADVLCGKEVGLGTINNMNKSYLGL